MAAELGSIIPVYKQAMSVFGEFLVIGASMGGSAGSLIGKIFSRSETREYAEKLSFFASWSGFAIGVLGMAIILLH